VGDEDTTIGGSLHGSEDTGTSRGTLKTDIQEALEGAGSILNGLGHGDGTIGLGDTLVLVGKTELGQDTASDKETSAVGGSPVGQTSLDTVLGELVSVSRGKNKVTLELSVDDLADDVSVGEADNKTVLGGVVLVLGLNDKTLAGVVVGLTLYLSIECKRQMINDTVQTHFSIGSSRAFSWMVPKPDVGGQKTKGSKCMFR
jgi:hypothetical protein